MLLNYIHSAKHIRFEPNPTTGKLNDGQGPVHPIDLFSLSRWYAFNKNLKFILAVENLFDKVYYTSTSIFVARNDEYARDNG